LDEPVVIPPEKLSREALEGLVEGFVLREGTDYGQCDHSLDDKRAAVLRQIENGEVVIVYDVGNDSCDLRLRRDLPAPGE